MKKLGLLFVILMLCLTTIYFVLAPKSNEFKEDDVYDSVLSRGFIKVGINTDSKPFGFYDEKGNIIGYDADLAHYIAQYIVKDYSKVKFIPVTPSNRLIKVATGDVDIIISTVTITPQRQEIVDFSIPYDIAGQALLVKSNSKITSLADLAGQNIGIIFGTTAERNIKKMVPTANLVGFRSYQEAYKALKLGNINAITSDDTILNRFASIDNEVKLLPKRYSKEPYGIAFKKGYSTVKLKENIDYAIKDMQQKNVISRLHNKWL